MALLAELPLPALRPRSPGIRPSLRERPSEASRMDQLSWEGSSGSGIAAGKPACSSGNEAALDPCIVGTGPDATGAHDQPRFDTPVECAHRPRVTAGKCNVGSLKMKWGLPRPSTT